MAIKRIAGLRSWGWLLILTLSLPAASAAQTERSSSRRIVVSIPDRKLAVLEYGYPVRVFAVSVGAPASPTPDGSFRIVHQLSNPTYYHPGTVIPPGRDNPIGPRWIGLNRKGYGIHGTNEPQSIGKAASHGCIRMRNREVVEFARMARVGDTVEIRAERDDEVARIFGGGAMTLAQQAIPDTPAGGQ
jgi:lipoprotein-anchoring transpeptidase ErfK/SrfK